MNIFGRKISPLLISVVCVAAVSAVIAVTTFSCAFNNLVFEASFYFVCFPSEDNAVSASSVSNAVSSYGGAGYILEHGNKFYVTVSCYYNENDAKTVCASLKNRGLDCEVLGIQTDEYPLQPFTTANEVAKYTGNLNTLYSLSNLAYECANGLDTGAYSQTDALSVIRNIESGLKGLFNANADNCFSPPLKSLLGECGNSSSGYIYAKNMRKLQIAIADTIINIRLY